MEEAVQPSLRTRGRWLVLGASILVLVAGVAALPAVAVGQRVDWVVLPVGLIEIGLFALFYVLLALDVQRRNTAR
jgi:hypothetical protein